MLSQSDADALLLLPKQQDGQESFQFPGGIGGKIVVPLQSLNQREKFLLDVRTTTINLSKITYQNRGRSAFVLARLDLGGGNHKNPDGEEIPCPHLHLYKEGYGDKWAIPAPQDTFSSLNDFWVTFENFCEYIGVVERPNVARGLFS